MPVTIYDVAKRAGVSTATVSKTLSNTPYVSEETRQKVLRAVEELGYRPSAVARSMASGRTHTLACIAPNLTDYTFACMIEGAQTEARKHDYFILTTSSNEGHGVRALVEEMLARKVDGLLVLNPHVDGRHRYFEPLMKRNMPVLYLSPGVHDPEILSVSCDNEGAGYEGTRYLLALGHRHIATIIGPGNESWTTNRLAGYKRALAEAGIPFEPCLVVRGDWSPESGYRAVKQLLGAGCAFSALFAQNDKMALGAMRALHEAGLTVPQHVSVIGFDDIPMARYFDPPLTTLHQPLHSFGAHAARLLIEKINQPDQPAKQVLLPAQLIKRQSCAPLRRTAAQHVR